MMAFALNLFLAAAAPGHGTAPDPSADEHAATQLIPALGGALEMLRPVMLGVISVGFVTLLIGIGLCLYRVLKGPHLADRVVATDALTLHLAGIAILLTIALATPLFFDAVLIIAIIGFASTVAFSQYIGSRLADDQRRLREEQEEAKHAEIEETVT